MLVALVVSGMWAAVANNQTPTDQVLKVENPNSGPVGIDQVANLTMAELSQQSDLIAMGKCVGTKTAWVDRSVVTLATIEINEVIKGEQRPTVTVVLPGGADTNRKIPVAMRYPGAPRIMSGEEVFLFLTDEDRDANGFKVTGYSQGKFAIVEDARGDKVIARNHSKVRLPEGTGAVSGTVTPLAKFKAEVQSHLQ